MKIIKQGVSPVKNILRFNCGYCGCIFEEEQGKCTASTQYNDIFYTHKCPTCDKTISVKQED